MKKTIFMSCIAIMQSGSVFAQTVQDLEEVIITSSKFEQKQSNVNRPVTVISQEEIQHNIGKSFVELLDAIPGIQLNGTSLNRGANVSLFMQGSRDGQVLILMDGMPLYDPSQLESTYDFNLINLDMIERIEVMNGGMSTLYGSGALAGVINIITKKGGNKPISANVLASVGSYNSNKESVGLNGTLNNKFDYNVSYSNDYSKGLSSALDTTGIAGYDRDSFRLQSVYANTGYRLSDDMSMRLFYRSNWSYTEYDYDAFIDDEDCFGNSSDNTLGFTMQKEGTGTNWRVNYNYSRVNRYFSNGVLSGAEESLVSDYAGNIQQVDAFVLSKVGSKMQLIYGASYLFTNISQETIYKSPYWESESYLNPDSTKSSLTSVYMVGNLVNTQRFNIELGGRLNYHNIYGFQPTYSFSTAYAFDNGLRLWGIVASAFKSPSLYQLYDPMYGNKDLTAETTTSFEVGVQQNLKSINTLLSLKTFLRNGNDVIGFEKKYVNYQQQKTSGMEFGIQSSFTPKFKTNLAYTYIQGGIVTDDGLIDNLFRQPSHALAVVANYKWNDKLYTSLSLNARGKCIDPYFNMNTYETEYLTLDGYALLGAYAEYYVIKKMKLFIDLKNITNKQYVEITGYTTKGFNVNAGVSVNL